MDAALDKDWKTKVGFPINYDSSDDDLNMDGVVLRYPRLSSSHYLLADGGDGAEADLLGTTPPRTLKRNKQIKSSGYRIHVEMDNGKVPRDRISLNDASRDTEYSSPTPMDRSKRRTGLKYQRAKDRDFKQELGHRESKSDSLPSPAPQPTVPTLEGYVNQEKILNVQVESCNRFMSLSSRLKCREALGAQPAPPEAPHDPLAPVDHVPPSRVDFHQTFSMLINMGNIDKGCRRTISREEQVWQNELKDLIWLELQAKIAGRTLAQQDHYLCTQRNVIPTIVQNIIDYRFVTTNPCLNRTRKLDPIEGSREDLTEEENVQELADDEGPVFGCVSVNCGPCVEAVGKALREVGTLLDSFHAAVSLYPSTKAMTADHPLIATQLFQNRMKAMCLWYNMAHHLRLKVLAVRRMIRFMAHKSQQRSRPNLPSVPSVPDSDLSRQSSEQRTCQVQFNLCANPSDSSNSEASSQSEGKEEELTGQRSGSESTGQVSESEPTGQVSEGETHKSVDSGKSDQEVKENAKNGDDEVDCHISSNQQSTSGSATPEIVIESGYGTNDTSTSSDGDSGPASRGWHRAKVANAANAAKGHSSPPEDVFSVGSLHELTMLRLLNKCAVSPFRFYHDEMLKTQGVRRCMMFINKMRKYMTKAYYTMQKPSSIESHRLQRQHSAEVFADARDDEDDAGRADHDSNVYELIRYGCWSEECLSMRLPSYRNHFLILNAICMEALHDYLSLRLEDRPDQPSCLTVKQLLYELKEGLDIATDMRATFVRNTEAALEGVSSVGRGGGGGEGGGAAHHLLLVIRTYDATVETVLHQYLSYLATVSRTEHMSRAYLQAEWTFTARLAKRIGGVAALAPPAFAEIACNQLQRLLNNFQVKFEELSKNSDVSESPGELVKQRVYAICREAQCVYASEREATLHSAQWARALAAKLARTRTRTRYHAHRRNIYNSLMAIRDCVVKHTELILEQTKIPLEDQFRELQTESVQGRLRDLLLQMYKLGFEIHKELHRMVKANCERAGVTKATPGVGVGTGAEALMAAGLRSRPRFIRSESVGEDYETSVFDDKMFDNIAQSPSNIEKLLAGAQPQEERENESGDEFDAVERRQQNSALLEEEKSWAVTVARAIISFARCWMRFVVERCDRGRGLRPRWASQGLEFLMLACDPCNTKHLSDEEFEELKHLMDGCISHVVGSRRAPRAPDTPASPAPPRRRHLQQSPQVNKEVPTPPTPPSEPDPLLNFQVGDSIDRSKGLEAIQRLDEARDGWLRSRKAVGRVLEAAVASYSPKLRQLTFKWQRGLKIGAGSFGKVYTVVNTDSGQLLAMKEISIGVNDRRALRRAANELKVLEGVVHPHLVRYYGCEIHREEMLLFMELCVEGSLEALVGTAGALPEPTVRRYAKQLLSAVAELHAGNIVHRDIKSGNVFLTNEGHCLKLGDFGCAVKIRANTTAPGELQGFVGTQAYMAPEVFMKSSGHGRAADIWSLGCVVTEMASGKRPFAEYDSNYQIMFVVGMGGRPEVPASLSSEGQAFCLACLTHDPDQRPRASALAAHHFLLVKSDDDCKCQPAYLITNKVQEGD